MQEVILNVLTHEGMRVVKVLSDSPLTLALSRWEREMPAITEGRVFISENCDQALGLFSVELRWPVFGRVDVAYPGLKRFRRFMMVHYSYATRVSECIRLAVDSFFVCTHFRPGYTFVRSLPQGIENGTEVDDVILIEAEWMPARCVAVGGRAD